MNFLILIFILVCVIPVGDYGVKYLEDKYKIQKNIDNIDFIAVLSGSESGQLTFDTGKLSLNDASERLIASVKLANDFPSSKIIFLGGNPNINGKINEAQVAKIFYEYVNFDLNRIIFKPLSRNTIENIKDLKDLNLNNKKIILITSAFHMNRSLLISKKYGLDLIPYPVDFRSHSFDSFNPINFYNNFDVSNNMSMFNIFLKELLATTLIKIIL